jgi:hypothetical protein
VRASGRQLSSVSFEAGLRVLEAARLFELLDGPFVIASGGVTERDAAAAPEAVALQRALVAVGVRADRILLEAESKNTRDEAVIVKRMLAERGVTDFVLVTSPLHMRRSMLVFEQEGIRRFRRHAARAHQSTGQPAAADEVWLRVGDTVVYEWRSAAITGGAAGAEAVAQSRATAVLRPTADERISLPLAWLPDPSTLRSMRTASADRREAGMLWMYAPSIASYFDRPRSSLRPMADAPSRSACEQNFAA